MSSVLLKLIIIVVCMFAAIGLSLTIYIIFVLVNDAIKRAGYDTYRTMEKLRLDRGWKPIRWKGSHEQYSKDVLADCEERIKNNAKQTTI